MSGIVEVFDEVIIDLKQHKGQEYPTYPMGLVELDDKAWGFHPSELAIVAGRPGEAKTSLLLFFALQFLRAEHKVLFFTLEMTKQELIRRMISQVARIENAKLRRNSFTDQELSDVETHRKTFEAFPLDIIEAGYKWSDIEGFTKSLKPTVVILDYIQQMNTEGFKSTAEALNNYVRLFKKLARDTNSIVIVCSQINRAPIERSNKRPLQEDLKGSGGLEENADIILANYWPWKYEAASMEEFEIGVIKQRHGPIGKCEVKFEPQYYWFSNKEVRDDMPHYE